MRRVVFVFGVWATSVMAQPAPFVLEHALELPELSAAADAPELVFPEMADMLFAQARTPKPPPPRPAVAPVPPVGSKPFALAGLDGKGSETMLYQRGSSFLDKRQWDQAVEAYDAVIAKKGSKVEGAMYWKAYALRKAGKLDQAVSVLNELEKTHPQSRWLNDAKALEIEISQARGKPVSPDEASDEDLKLMAIHSLSQSSPERAVPLLEKVLSGTSSPRLKEHAMFVLSQIDQPRSREVILEVAKGKGNPDLQVKAVQLIGMMKGSATDLASIYSAGTDPTVKRMIIDVLSMQKDVKPLVEIARNEKDPTLKREAIRRVGMSNSKEATDLLIEILEK